METATNSNPPPPWQIGLGFLTFGLVAGFIITTLPFLLSKAGVTVDHIATVSAVAMSPTFWAFLVTPIVDVGLTRRAYSFGFAFASAGCLGAALWLFSPARLSLFTALLLLAELAIVLQSAGVYGWISEFVPDTERGKVGGWINAANLGGGAFGAMLTMWLATRLPFRTLGMIITFAVLASTLFLLRFPQPAEPVLGLRQIFGGTFRSVVQTSRQPQVLTGFLLFLTPVGCVAAINLFAGLGNEFHASPQWVVWITGAGAAITSAFGSVVGGYIADRVDRGVLYISGGVLRPVRSRDGCRSPYASRIHGRSARLQRRGGFKLCGVFSVGFAISGNPKSDRGHPARAIRGRIQRRHRVYDLDGRPGIPNGRHPRTFAGGRLGCHRSGHSAASVLAMARGKKEPCRGRSPASPRKRSA